MDSICYIIQPFSNDEIKEFKSFVNRQRKRKNRKDLELFNVLLTQPEIKPEAAMRIIYKKNNPEAYYALRKKLIRHITDYIQLKQLEINADTSGTLGLIGLSKYLFNNNAEQLAWKYLEKAEQSALKNEEHDLLNQIYNLQIEHFENESAPDLSIILRKYEINKKQVLLNEQANIAFSIIKEKLHTVKLSGKTINFDKLIKEILKKYELTNIFYSRPKLFFQIMSIFRSRIVAEKDYNSFENFIITNFERFSKKTGFGTGDSIYKANLLYMISHTLYRNKKFENSLQYLEQLKTTFLSITKTDYSNLHPKYLLLQASNHFFTGKISNVIQSMEENISTSVFKSNTTDQLNMQINLAFFYLYQNKPSTASKTIIKIFHSNKWCEKIMGIEWVVKKEMLEILIQYDLKNPDLAYKKIKSVEKICTNYKNPENFSRIRAFLELLKSIIENPTYATSKELYNKVETSFKWAPFEQEDLHAFLYYAWFKSKMIEKPAYEVLLDLLKS